jgi:hypothetical protein
MTHQVGLPRSAIGFDWLVGPVSEDTRHRSPSPETIEDPIPNGSVQPSSSTADRCAGWHKMAQDGTVSEGPHHRSPRPKRFTIKSPAGSVQSPSAMAWTIGSGVPERGFAHCGSLRCVALNGTGWQHFRRSPSPISKLRNDLAPYGETGWYSRRRRCRSVPSMSLYFDANAYAGLHWHNRTKH